MPYTPNASQLDELIREALATDEIKKASASNNLSDEFLIARLKRRGERLWQAASSEIGAYNSLEFEINAKESQLKSIEHPLIERIVNVAADLIPALPGLLTIGYVISGFAVGWSTVPKKIIGLGIPAAVILLSAFAAAAVSPLLLARRYRLRREKATAAMRDKLGLPSQESSLKEADQAIRQAVLQKGIMGEIREIIHQETTPSDATELPDDISAAGLAEVFDPAYEISTGARDKLRRMLSSMPGGSIGIAGPRGAGKSTLLASICATKTDEKTQRKALSVLLPAPVEYQARDFLLHIFSSLCKRVLELTGVEDRRDNWQALEALALPARPRLEKLLGRLSFVALGFGILLLIAGVWLADFASRQKPAAAVPAAANQTQSSQPAQANQGASNAGTADPGFGDLVNAMEINPGSVFIAGAMLTLASFGFFIFSSIRRGRFDPLMYREWFKDEQPHPSQQEENIPPIGLKARNELREIRFQQSFSSGWSGTLKLPVGFEGALQSATSLAQNQLSLPEVVDRFRKFAKDSAQQYQVIVGIDELDKLESDESAQRFLNDIKAIFGIEQVYYLISVSESAMSSFERRGLPFRDAFDSSFDNIVYVDYLNLNEAQRLLSRRVIGLPSPFVCLCHSLSGGLARDLIRVCRDLLELHHTDPVKKGLSLLANSLLETDLRRKLRAITVAAKKITLEPDVSDFLSRIANLGGPIQANRLLAFCADLSAGNGAEPKGNGESEEIAKRRSQVTSLRTEFAAYLCYLATLLEFFHQVENSNKSQQASSAIVVDKLTRARQYFAVNPNVAKSLVNDSRQLLGLAPITETAKA